MVQFWGSRETKFVETHSSNHINIMQTLCVCVCMCACVCVYVSLSLLKTVVEVCVHSNKIEERKVA
jgi:hypothetical protein